MEVVQEKLLSYLADSLKDFKVENRGKIQVFTCPVCKTVASCNIIPHTYTMYCHNCNQSIGDIYWAVRHIENKPDYSNEDIDEYIIKKYNIPVITHRHIDNLLKNYEKLGFDLVPIQRNGKIPIEKEWTVKNHKDIEEWKNWIDNSLNIGVKTGKISNITILDIDSDKMPDVLQVHLNDYQGLVQKSTKGYHYFFKYSAELPKCSLDIDGVHIDIENDGGQVVISPSVVSGIRREIIDISSELPEMSKDLISLLLKLAKKTNKITEENHTELANPEIALDDFKLVEEGNRNSFLIHFGGILRKELNIDQTRYVLDVANKKFLNPPVSARELNTVVSSLDKYVKFEEHNLSQKILEYLKIVGEANSRDIKEITCESKEKVDKALAWLLKEGYILKGSHRLYHIIRRASWKDTFEKLDNRLKFTVPYFYDIAHFNYGDLILLGSKSKWGKTTISMNIVKKLVAEGIKPYYISLETGSRFLNTAIKLGMKEGDFYWAFEADPTKIELEKESITIIDWLLIEDKAETDKIMKHFVEQLFKTNGFLIVFMQLKANGDYFAPNMVLQFPALAARYFYENENDGTSGYWLVDVIREAKDRVKKTKIPCVYNWDTREHDRVDNLVSVQNNSIL